MVDNHKRDYILHLPAGYKAGEPIPLVFVFHGGGGNSAQMQRHFEMDPIADREKFIVVYPNSINKNWNDGREFDEKVTGKDDVKFINQLLDTLIKNYSINPKRVFATGISNGGFFSYYLSYKLSHRILAVAPFCATIPERIKNEFYPANPVSILIINGTKDPLVPYEGGIVGNKIIGNRGGCISTDSTVARYITVNKTEDKPVITTLPDNNKKDGCNAVEYRYSNGKDNTSVVLVKVMDGGHTIPGCSQNLPKFIVGRVCRDFKGNEMVWEFFKNCRERV